MRARCTTSMRIFLAAAVLALCLVPAATAKFRISLALGDSTPAVRQPVTVVVRSGVDLDYDLKLIAVAPGKSWYDVVGVITGDSRIARANIPRDGFAIRLVRRAPNRWHGLVRFPRAGRWRLVVPNGAPVGFAIPPPVMRTVVVGAHRPSGDDRRSRSGDRPRRAYPARGGELESPRLWQQRHSRSPGSRALARAIALEQAKTAPGDAVEDVLVLLSCASPSRRRRSQPRAGGRAGSASASAR